MVEHIARMLAVSAETFIVVCAVKVEFFCEQSGLD